MRLFLISVSLGLIAQLNVSAQGSSKFHIWTDFTPSYKLSDHWRLAGDVGYRFSLTSSWQSAYIRPGISYIFHKNITFSVGAAYFHTWEPQVYNTSEFRSFQFLVVAWPRIGNFQFRHRLGIEQRWLSSNELNLDEYVNRARYYLELISPKFTLFNLPAPFFITANFEILRDIENNEIGKLGDHNRYTIGIGNHINDRFRAEMRFKIINSVDPIINSYVREVNVIRVRLYYKFVST